MIVRKASLNNRRKPALWSHNRIHILRNTGIMLMCAIDMLKEILKQDIKESAEEFKERLTVLSKEELIAEMLRKKVRTVQNVSFSSPTAVVYVYDCDSPPFGLEMRILR